MICLLRRRRCADDRFPCPGTQGDDRRYQRDVLYQEWLRWRMLRGLRAHKTSTIVRAWSAGRVQRICDGGRGKPRRLMIERPSEGAPDAQPFKKGVFPTYRADQRRLNSKLHACAMAGRPLIMLLSEGQMSDYKGAALMLTPAAARSSRRQRL